MDYWEFAQFIVILAMPRLRCLKSLPEGDNAYTELKQFVDKVATKHTITFFKSGSFPHGLYGKPLSDSSLISCLNVQANFKEFVDVFPSGMKQLLEQGTCDSSSGQVYRAFELLALSSVAKELIKILEQ